MTVENCALLGGYTACGGNSLTPFRDNLGVPSSRGMGSLSLKMEPIGYPETSVRNYHYTLCNSPEEFSSYLFSCGSLKY